MNIAILCNTIDESTSLMKQIKLINKEFPVKLLATPVSLRENIAVGDRVDLLFIDTDSHLSEGLCLMQYICETSPSTLIVCLTTSNYLILKCNEYVWKYIVKPYRTDEIKDSLIKAQRIHAPQMLLLPTVSSKEHMLLNIHDIIYFEMFDKCGVVHTVGHKQFQFRTTLGNLEIRLKDNGFFRPHKSYLLNIEHIQYISDEAITMKDGTYLPLSRNRKNTFYKLLSDCSEIILI